MGIKPRLKGLKRAAFIVSGVETPKRRKSPKVEVPGMPLTTEASLKTMKFEALSRRYVIASVTMPGGFHTANKLTVAAMKRARAMTARMLRKMDNAIAETKRFKT